MFPVLLMAPSLVTPPRAAVWLIEVRGHVGEDVSANNFVAEEDKEDEEDHRLQFRTARSARRRGSW